jgi:hypothetical protein
MRGSNMCLLRPVCTYVVPKISSERSFVVRISREPCTSLCPLPVGSYHLVPATEKRLIMTAATTLLEKQRSEKALSARKASENCKHLLERRNVRHTRATLQRSDSAKENRRSAQRVRFTSSSNILVTNRFPCASEDAQNSWYNESDYDAFQSDCLTTVTAFVMARARKLQGDQKYHLDGSKFTARGLEDVLTKERSESRDYRKRLHAHHVLKQQYLQRCEGLDSPDWIKSISEKYSAVSCGSAFQRGNRRTPPY